MPRTKSKPPNRSQLKKAREELRRLPPEQREELRYNGIGPGDSYVGMWRMLNRDRYHLEQIEQKMAAINLRLAANPENAVELRAEKGLLDAKDDILTQRIMTTYGKLLIHEKPRLQSVEVKGDQGGPIYHEVDLDRLSREDLLALARILPKLGAAQSEDPTPAAIRHQMGEPKGGSLR
jgi:hypothetical protein